MGLRYRGFSSHASAAAAATASPPTTSRSSFLPIFIFSAHFFHFQFCVQYIRKFSNIYKSKGLDATGQFCAQV